MKYAGSCHCGKVAFEVEGEISEAMECNCSWCRRRGSLLWFAPREALRLSTPEAGLATYTFNTHRIRHRFCPDCGVAVYSEAPHPATGAMMVAVNVRCLPALDLDGLKLGKFDGASL